MPIFFQKLEVNFLFGIKLIIRYELKKVHIDTYPNFTIFVETA